MLLGVSFELAHFQGFWGWHKWNVGLIIQHISSSISVPLFEIIFQSDTCFTFIFFFCTPLVLHFSELNFLYLPGTLEPGSMWDVGDYVWRRSVNWCEKQPSIQVFQSLIFVYEFISFVWFFHLIWISDNFLPSHTDNFLFVCSTMLCTFWRHLACSFQILSVELTLSCIDMSWLVTTIETISADTSASLNELFI